MMSSSKGTGAKGKAVASERPIVSTSPAGDDRDGVLADPWFTPGPKQAAEAAPDPADAEYARRAENEDTAAWFLRAGRAGLQPDSMTVSWADDAGSHPDRGPQPEAAGTPPWGAEPADSAAGAPPPWETGPWPGPAEAVRAATELRAPALSAEPPIASTAAWLRRRRVQVGLAGAAGLVVVVVIIVVIVVATSGSPGCGTYPSAVRQAYASAMSDLRAHAPTSVQAAAFGQAATQANAAAAAAGQIAVRTALFRMASDLDQAHADVLAHRAGALPATLLQRLSADGTALPASCPS
jgi:hypothetical protein